ncbi:hypothetical protein [Herminiimonas aquatilis]|uniref:Uncharacterized protein n=1 Tax=Herminiimonas aquatilis TaxID=345342 RepID=A0ABW2J3J8_9BURK
MNETIGFPTLGELVQFSYDAFGVLPRKRSLDNEINESNKKSIQKALIRLKNEEGDINENMGSLIKDLSFLIAGHIPNPRVSLAIGEILADIEELYLSVLQSEGTYWDKKKTIQWVISDHLISRFAFSLHRNMLSFNVAAGGLKMPDGYWFLPIFSDKKITMPLETVMRWIYGQCECTQASFHCPQGALSQENFEQSRRLDNAKNWIKSRKPPSLSGLMWNFNEGFKALSGSKGEMPTITITPQMRESFSIALVLGRASSYVFNAILENFGRAYAEEICSQFREQYAHAEEEFHDFKVGNEQYVADEKFSLIEADRFWAEETELFCKGYRDNMAEYNAFFRSIPFEMHGEWIASEAKRDQLIQQFGKLVVSDLVGQRQRSANRNEVPQAFWICLGKGLELKSNPLVSAEEIESLEQEAKAARVDKLLGWLVPWLRANRYYRLGESALAFHEIEDAFFKAKYCAGGNQRTVVKLFVKLAARNKKWSAFKRGVSWAAFIRLDFPWLRNGLPSDDKMKYLFEEMGVQ